MTRLGSLGTVVLLTMAMTLSVSNVRAHDTWIQVPSHILSKGQKVELTVANSHSFPAPESDLLPPERIQMITIFGPDGKEVGVEPAGEKGYRSKVPLGEEGTYVAVAVPQGGFFSKTTTGYQRGKSKKDIQGVIECKYVEKYAKALLSVGTPGGEHFFRPLGHKLEIVPLKDPAVLKAGDELPVKVFLDGKPIQIEIRATFAGFSPEKDAFALTTETGRDGVARIKVGKAGTWLILAKYDSPYYDATVCDKLSYGASLTFQIK